MAVTKKTRRIVGAADVVKDAIIQRKDLEKPEEPLTKQVQDVLQLTYEQRLERQIKMASLALNKYEKKLMSGWELNIDEERMMISQQDSLRKLETTLQALNAKKNLGDESDLDLAMGIWQHTQDFEQACAAFAHNPDLPSELREAIDKLKK